MKRLIYLLIPAVILASCGGGDKPGNAGNLDKLKQERADLDAKIKKMEGDKPDTANQKITPVSLMEVQPKDFSAFVEVQAAISGDENILATSQAPGLVKTLSAHTGQKVGMGQVLATLDAATIEQQIAAQDPQLTLLKSVYEKQQNLWAQNIGTEVQLMTAKANYDAMLKNIAALKSQRDMYRIVSPISGIVDAVNVKIGESCQPGVSGIRVVSYAQLKAEASLGENYLGKITQGDRVKLLLPDVNDTINTALTYISQAVDPLSRAFIVQVHLPNNARLHPNMACIMQIYNYENKSALVVPVSVIQNTSAGTTLYVADGDKARSVNVVAGRNSNGMVEILSGLKPGDKVITKGFEELDNGQRLLIQ